MSQQNRLYKSFFSIATAVICLLLLLPSFRIFPLGAQTQPTTGIARDQDIEARVETFLGTLSSGNATSAIDRFLQMSPLGAPGAAPQRTELRTKIDELEAFGKIINWERIETKSIGTDVSVVRYVLKYELHPVLWTFVFYRKPSSTTSMPSSNTWVVVELHFETSFW
jgi:hypothetical protein